MLKVCEWLRHQVRPVTYDLFRFLATNDTIFQLAIALRVGRIANCELWTKAERVMSGRQRGSYFCHTPPFGDIILSHLSHSLSLCPSLTRLLYQMPRTWPPHGPIFSLLCSLFMATLREGGSWNGVQMRSDQNLLCCPQPRPSAAFISKFMSLSWESIWFLYPLRT